MTRGSRWMLVALAVCACSARGMQGAPPAPDGEAPADVAAGDAPEEASAGGDAPDAATPLDVAPPDVNPLDAPPADAPDDARRPCARDGDCTGLSLCGPAGFCVPLACTPGRAACLDATRLEACDARGAASTVTECPAGCVDGACSRCPSPTTACAGRCVTTATDPSHCGACGRACASDQACEGGACVVPCASPRTRCGSVCVDLQSDAANCGGCGRACPASQVCMAGACAAVCAAPLTRCGAACADLQTDATNCGGCGTACPAGQRCVGGACALPCAPPEALCGAACVNLQTNASNCGACGRACPTGQLCEAGACAAPCASPRTRCGSACVDLQSDAANCGGCGRACSAGQTCAAGACVTGCASPRVICGTSCVDLQASAANCGACGRACVSGQYCVRGACGTMPPLYHGWTCPVAGCSTASYNLTAPTNQGGVYPYNSGDTNACRAWKLAATVCTTQPTSYTDTNNWQCPMAGGFTDPAFGTFCAVTNQYACSTCPGACNASCIYIPLSLRNCMGVEATQN